MNKPMVHITIERESCKKTAYFYFFPDDFGLRSPVIQKKNSQKKVYLYRSTCVLYEVLYYTNENTTTTPVVRSNILSKLIFASCV